MELLQLSSLQTKSIALRVLFFACAVFALAFTPWWTVLAIIALGITVFRYYELFLIGLFLDSVYQNFSGFFLESDYLFTSSLLLCTTASLVLSRYLYRV